MHDGSDDRVPGEANRTPGRRTGSVAEQARARQAHYSEWLGTPSHVWHEDRVAVPHVDIYVYPPAPDLKRDTYTLVTSGMSDARMNVPSEAGGARDRVEMIQYLGEFDEEQAGQQWPWYVSTMFYLAHLPFAHRAWLGPSHTVPNGEPPEPLIAGSLLTSAFLLPPMFEEAGFADGLRLGGQPVGFLWLTFITDQELRFKLDQGSRAIIERFQREHFPQILHPFRPSFIMD